MKTVSIKVEDLKNENFKIKKISNSVADLKTQATTDAAAKPETAKTEPNQGGGLPMFVLMGVMFAAFYFLIIRPGNKRQKELADKVAKVKKDDKVRTAGGIIAIVDKVDETEVVLRVDEKTKITFAKSAIVEIYSGLTPAK